MYPSGSFLKLPLVVMFSIFFFSNCSRRTNSCSSWMLRGPHNQMQQALLVQPGSPLMHSLCNSAYSATNQEAAVTLVSRPFHARSESYTYRTENPRLVCNKLTFQTKLNFFVRSGLTCMKRHRLKLRSNFLCVKQTCPQKELFEAEKWLRYQMSWPRSCNSRNPFSFFFVQLKIQITDPVADRKTGTRVSSRDEAVCCVYC